GDEGPAALQAAGEQEEFEAPPERPAEPGVSGHDGGDAGADVEGRPGAHEDGEAVIVVEGVDQPVEDVGVAFDVFGVASSGALGNRPSAGAGGVDHEFGGEFGGGEREIEIGRASWRGRVWDAVSGSEREEGRRRG